MKQMGRGVGGLRQWERGTRLKCDIYDKSGGVGVGGCNKLWRDLYARRPLSHAGPALVDFRVW